MILKDEVEATIAMIISPILDDVEIQTNSDRSSTPLAP